MDKTESEEQELKSHEAFPNYHPSYPADSHGADLVLLSKDGVHFNVHSIVLQLTSAFFRDMLGIPRSSSESSQDAIPMEESAEVIAGLLDIIYPNGLLRNASTTKAIELYADELLRAGDKFEMPAIVPAVKNHFFHAAGGITVPSNEDCWSAIRLYDLACRHNWVEEARMASGWTLHHSLATPQAIYELHRVSARSILQLQELHRMRLHDYLDYLPKAIKIIVAKWHTGKALRNKKGQKIVQVIQGCHPQSNFKSAPQDCIIASDAWQHFIYKITEELTSDPLGSRLLNDSTWDSRGYAQIFEIQHSEECICTGLVIPEKGEFISKAQDKLKELPTSI